jgi:(p)ppGpp synthase/HD superfamily hydrolase
MKTSRPAYSDLVNHAFAYAALHPAGRTRKGTRVPYITHPGHVALILARYCQDDETLAAALLHDVIEDCELPGHTRAFHEAQIGEKFGASVLRTVLDVTHAERGADGRALGSAEKKDVYLAHLADACERARWICAADKLHNARSILSDIARAEAPVKVWARFNVEPPETMRWYRRVHDRLREVGFDGAILEELHDAVIALEKLALPSANELRVARAEPSDG